MGVIILFIKVLFVVTIGSFFSLVGTMLGASIGILFKKPSNRIIGCINAFAAGLMLSIVMIDLIPEAINKINFFNAMIFALMGMLIIMLIDLISDKNKMFSDSHLKIAFMAALGLMIHNFPEGIIMGAGFLANAELGIKMSILIAIHDVPEGIAVAAPLMASNKAAYKIMTYAFITALPTVLGSWLGVFLGSISEVVLGECLGVASGVMLYVIFGQMIPESLKLWRGKTVTISTLIGMIFGLVITNVL
ncbi:ZIP family metal transporter [Clostridium homopropionicum]|uniref:ZIP family metal transporter n=1 Tax=Clostridium homopropionicum TaxID=36844 RepID=UPI00068979DF